MSEEYSIADSKQTDFGLGVDAQTEDPLIPDSPCPSGLSAWPCHGWDLPCWLPADGQHWNQIDYIVCNQRWRNSIQSAKTRPGADCGSDHELLIAKFRLKLKKVEKTIRPFRYDLNQIPYDYKVEVRNRFKGLDLIECLAGSQHGRSHPWQVHVERPGGQGGSGLKGSSAQASSCNQNLSVLLFHISHQHLWH